MSTIAGIIAMLGIGLLAGFLGSLLGIGGGIIVTPFITVILGVDIKYAIAASIIVVIATSTGSTINYLKENILNLRVAMFLEIFTTIGALIGALLVGIVSPQLLYAIFGCFLLFSAFNMIRNLKDNLIKKSSPLALKLKLNGSYYDKSLNKQINYGVEKVPLGSAVMFIAGIASGLLGIGSGPFKVIAMDTVMKLPLKVSTSTSNLMMGVTAAASAVVYFFNGQIQCDIAVPIVLGVVGGSIIGTKVMPHIKPKVLHIIFIPVLVLFSVSMIVKAFGA